VQDQLRKVLLTVLAAGAVCMAFYQLREARGQLAHRAGPEVSDARVRIESSAPGAPLAQRSAADAPPTTSAVGNVQKGPLDDHHFAALSAKIVIAATALKQDENWSFEVLQYMEKVLRADDVTPEEYKAYAEKLHQDPQRAKVVADDIMGRVERVTGYRVDLKTLPMFKFDASEVKRLDKRLREEVKP
jgi:hypothetical protein